MRQFFAVIMFLLPGSCCNAGFQTFTSRAAFNAAAVGELNEVNFDTFPVGDLISGVELNGITFTYDLGGVDLRITSGFQTTSDPNYLGTNDGDIFQGGDSFVMNFSERAGVGLYIISADDLFDGDVSLEFGGASVDLIAADVEQDFGLDGRAWFLGIQTDDLSTFTTATLTSPGGPVFLFNADNVVTLKIVATPEPAMIGLLGLPAVMVFARRKRFQRKSAALN